MSDRLFDIEDVPEVPLLREPRVRKGAARGSMSDARFANDYPPDWDSCQECFGQGVASRISHDSWSPLDLKSWPRDELLAHRRENPCPACLGMGSLKARVRLEAGHRCVRCHHYWMPKGDAVMLGVERSGMQVVDPQYPPLWTPWSPCDDECTHGGLIEAMTQDEQWIEIAVDGYDIEERKQAWHTRRAKWRILTVHHLDGDKANCRWWNLAALCQRCHLEIQAKVVMERVYPHEHSEWFKPYVAGYYAFVYLCKTCGIRVDWRAHTGPFAHPPSRPYILLDRLKHMAGEGGYPHRCEAGLEISRDEAMAHLVPLLELERVG